MRIYTPAVGAGPPSGAATASMGRPFLPLPLRDLGLVSYGKCRDCVYLGLCIAYTGGGGYVAGLSFWGGTRDGSSALPCVTWVVVG